MARARGFVAEPPCAICRRPATRVELRREGTGWRFVYSGIAAGNGQGHLVSDVVADILEAAFADPPNFELMKKADLQYDNAGHCEECGLAYCSMHWRSSTSGSGVCPRGHGKSLDPHWSPDGHPSEMGTPPSQRSGAGTALGRTQVKQHRLLVQEGRPQPHVA
jgi:hypothetical protein